MSKWIEEAYKHLGLKEIVGKGTNLTIQSWLSSLRSWWKDDETPWCGTFVAHCLNTTGYPIAKNWYRAMDWLNWGVALGAPCYGCVVIFHRKGGGHVGFVIGTDAQGRLLVLGGNQNNSVSVSAFSKDRVVGYRMPVGTFSRPALPTIVSAIKDSTSEA